MSFLPTTEAVFVPAGRLYARKLTEARAADFGLTRSYEFTPEVVEAELRNNNSGVDTLFTTRTKTVGGTVSFEVDLVTARNLAFWAYGQEAFHTQSASTGLVIDEDDIIAGQITKLNGLNVTDVTITAGATALVAGVDYSLNAKAGLIRWLKNYASAGGTYGRPAITSADAKSIVRVMTATGGIEVFLTLEGTSDVGQQLLIEGQRVRIRPSGSMAGISQDADFGTMAFEGSLIANDLNAAEPFGRITLL
ncbi:MAG: hypothetical protein MEQ74_05150 [Paracoccus sp.]|nr:hypothetical protein [Paracoccus sp. (in: a-proteobacteria)]